MKFVEWGDGGDYPLGFKSIVPMSDDIGTRSIVI